MYSTEFLFLSGDMKKTVPLRARITEELASELDTVGKHLDKSCQNPPMPLNPVGMKFFSVVVACAVVLTFVAWRLTAPAFEFHSGRNGMDLWKCNNRTGEVWFSQQGEQFKAVP